MAESQVIAIDGPSGAGKSTVARQVAALLGLPVLDTGATYRALGWKLLESGVDPQDPEAVLAALRASRVELRRRAGKLEVWLDGEAVGEAIRRPEVAEVTSQISIYPEVRHRMVELQRRAAERRGAVVEGRDIGTVVFPATPHKFFLEARGEVRAERRRAQLGTAGAAPSVEAVGAELRRRDDRDRRRDESPLRCDGSYTVIDTSDLTVTEVVERIVELVRRGDRRPAEAT